MEVLVAIGIGLLIWRFFRNAKLRDRAMDEIATLHVYRMKKQDADNTRLEMMGRYVGALMQRPSERPSHQVMMQMLYTAAAAMDHIHELEGKPSGYAHRTAIRKEMLIAAHEEANKRI